MDAAAAVAMNQALLQQTLALTAVKQASEVPQLAQMLANATPTPQGNAPSVPAGTNGRIIDILA
jgi:hypothetical protein